MSIMNNFRQMTKGENSDMENQYMKAFEGIRNPNEPHLACVLLLDTSISMGTETGRGKRIDLLNQAIARLKNEMMMDEFARKRVDIAVVSYSDGARVVCDWTPLEYFQAPTLREGGMTAMGEGINLAMDMGKERRRFYKNMGTPSYAVHIYNVTDGMPNDDMTRAEARIREEDQKGLKCKTKFFNCAVPGADEQYLARLAKRSVKIEETAFDKLFNWIGQSMIEVSCSSTDENVKLPDLPNGVQRIPTDW